MVFALVIVAIMLGSTLLVVVLGDMGVFDPPYPSESTALEMVDGNVVWTGELDTWNADSTFDYRNIRLNWFVTSMGRHSTDELANYTLLSAGSLVTVNRSLDFSYSVDGVHYDDVRQLQVTDLEGNGLFESGDYITFDFGESGVPEDIVHTVALADVVSGWNDEFSFAVHKDKFYSWNSNEFPSVDPWWATL